MLAVELEKLYRLDGKGESSSQLLQAEGTQFRGDKLVAAELLVVQDVQLAVLKKNEGGNP